MNFMPHITRTPAICGGEPVVTGARTTVPTVLASLAKGMDTETLMQDDPTLSRDVICTVIAVAAVSAETDLPVAGLPAVA